ncbi:hypothetical protein C8J56DRAFT_905121 [Mycena floridula]|nr:hypothetical protein C8J56DRAFT_905121 [Mycena floridula]
MSLTNILNLPLTKHQRHYALHAEERRAAAHKYYHEKRKFVLQDRRRTDALSHAALSPSPAASSPLPASSPPPQLSDDDSDDDEAAAAVLQDLHNLEKSIANWERHWGGRRIWNLVAEQVLVPLPGRLSKSLDEQLWFEYEYQVSQGQKLLGEIWILAERWLQTYETDFNRRQTSQGWCKTCLAIQNMTSSDLGFSRNVWLPIRELSIPPTQHIEGEATPQYWSRYSFQSSDRSITLCFKFFAISMFAPETRVQPHSELKFLFVHFLDNSKNSK